RAAARTAPMPDRNSGRSGMPALGWRTRTGSCAAMRDSKPRTRASRPALRSEPACPYQRRATTRRDDSDARYLIARAHTEHVHDQASDQRDAPDREQDLAPGLVGFAVGLVALHPRAPAVGDVVRERVRLPCQVRAG